MLKFLLFGLIFGLSVSAHAQKKTTAKPKVSKGEALLALSARFAY